ncbi:MAG TPA: hypothetical protein VFA68_20275 [Terriglobales bacterium]|nr:hypothetical protein [Terriglobales bacterium]
MVVFDGAFGAQTLGTWDPNGYYKDPQHPCIYFPLYDPECNYDHVQTELSANGYSEKQVQVVFLKSSDGNPQCDLKGTLQSCAGGVKPDAYTAEEFMGNIMRYLKCCRADGVTPRYANLKQVFITSRIYGGYANSLNHGCTVNPEPFAYQTVTKL